MVYFAQIIITSKPLRPWVSKPGVGVIIGWGRKEVIGSVESLRYRKGWMYKTSKI